MGFTEKTADDDAQGSGLRAARPREIPSTLRRRLYEGHFDDGHFGRRTLCSFYLSLKNDFFARLSLKNDDRTTKKINPSKTSIPQKHSDKIAEIPM